MGIALSTDADASNYGGWFNARGPNGVGLYTKGGAQGHAALFNGKVRISQSTPSTQPSEMMIAGGIIESRSGGIKFTDGSIQTTAAAPLPRNLFTVRTTDFQVSPGNMQERGVSCNNNEVTTGGGIRTEDDHTLNIWKNMPRSNASGWGVGISN